MESVCAWPFSDVPPARNTSGVPLRRANAQQRCDVGDVAWDHDRLRDQPVRAGVGGVADEVERAREDLVGAERARRARLRSGSGVPAATQSGARSPTRVRATVRSTVSAAHSSHIPDATCTCTSRGPSSTAIVLAQRLGQLLAPA